MKKRNPGPMFLFLLIFFLLCESGFAADNLIQPATVYFIHQPKTSQKIYIFNGNRFITLLNRNTYFPARLNPGLNTILYSNGKNMDILNILEFIPGGVYYIDIGDNGYHSLLNQTEGLRLLQKISTQASFDPKAQKRAAAILKKSDSPLIQNQSEKPLPISAADSNPGNDPLNIKLQRFTPIKLVLAEDFSANNYQTNSPVVFRVSEDVITGNQVIIPKETLVKGNQLKCVPSQSSGRPAFIDIIISKIQVDRGLEIPVIGRYIKSGISAETKAKNIRNSGYLLILWEYPTFIEALGELFLVDNIVAGVKGKNLTIPAGEEFIVWTRYDTYVGQEPNVSSAEEQGFELSNADNIPSEVIFPNINCSFGVNTIAAYDILFAEIAKYKLGHIITPAEFSDFKNAVYQDKNLIDTPAFTCAKKTSGYYLQVDLNIGANQIDKGTFTLIDPGTSGSICKVEIRSYNSNSSSYDSSAENLLQKGVKKLWRELQKVRPDIIKET